jgi:hypothetical protein
VTAGAACELLAGQQCSRGTVRGGKLQFQQHGCVQDSRYTLSEAARHSRSKLGACRTAAACFQKQRGATAAVGVLAGLQTHRQKQQAAVVMAYACRTAGALPSAVGRSCSNTDRCLQDSNGTLSEVVSCSCSVVDACRTAGASTSRRTWPLTHATSRLLSCLLTGWLCGTHVVLQVP